MWHRRAAWNLGKVASWSTRRHSTTPVHSVSATLIKTMVMVVVVIVVAVVVVEVVVKVKKG